MQLSENLLGHAIDLNASQNRSVATRAHVSLDAQKTNHAFSGESIGTSSHAQPHSEELVLTIHRHKTSAWLLLVLPHFRSQKISIMPEKPRASPSYCPHREEHAASIMYVSAAVVKHLRQS